MSEAIHDDRWCEQLYHAKAAVLLLYGRALGLSHNEAEDALQETFMALLRAPRRPDDPEHYCLRCYRNRALNYRRGVWRRLTRELESKRWFEKSPIREPAEAAAMRALEDLPREQREVIVLKIWHRHTFQQIGLLLDVSPNTIAGRYRYGIARLKSSLQGIDHEDPESLRTTFGELDPAPSLCENP
jgi:RNA polymerase sigma-70 factor (ECF subfamily)